MNGSFMWFSRAGNHPDGMKASASLPVSSVLWFQGVCGQRGQGSGTREEEKEEHSKGLLSVPSGLSPPAGALYLFRQSSWLSGLHPAAFLLCGLPIGRSFAGEGGRELFLQKVPSSGPIPLPRQVSFRQKAPDLPR